MGNELISVYLADDHAMVRDGLATLIADHGKFRIVGQCGDGLKVVDEVVSLQPDVAVVDISMPGLNGLDICREIVRKVDKIAVLILTMYEDEQFIATALENGASGYLMKTAAAEKFAEAILAVARGELYLSPGVSRNVLKRFGRDDPYQSLTSRERQVLHMVVEGKTNRQIAAELNVAIKTVDTHRMRLMRKLNIHDQTSLVKYALKKGIVRLD